MAFCVHAPEHTEWTRGLPVARTPLLTFSHLRWEFVYQRPQHVMSRIAQTRPVLFIEEPLGNAPSDTWERTEVSRGLCVYRPRLRGEVSELGGFDPAYSQRMVALLEQLVMHEGIGRHTAWLYTPQALPMAHALAPEVLVYDCMDELANFRNASPELPALERELLRHADVVFTGGPSLYRAKKDLHPNVYCFPSSVDVEHFAKGRMGGPVATDIESLPRPRLGYYGVIDERFDATLIDAMSTAHPDWQIVLVGPVVKIDANELPRRDNIHYVGARPYKDLPRYLAGWDVCLLPFALNAATRYISPTKTLEYMASEHPIVTTSIRDVVGPYGDVVYVGDGPADFVAACEQALAARPNEVNRRRADMKKILANTSWDETVRGMLGAIAGAERRFAHNGRSIGLLVEATSPTTAITAP